MPNPWIRRLANQLTVPVHALPVDVFRIAAGVVVFGYVLRVLIEAPLFHAGDGLLDHAIIRAVFPFTWQPLFHADWPLWSMQVVLGVALLGCAGIGLGWYPRRCALLSYVIVVCSIRYNFLIVSVDDVIAHLLLFWLILLPTGATLAIRTNPKNWKTRTVPGGTVRLFLGNVALIYFVAGVSKWASPMWLDGTALYAVLGVRPGWFSNLIEPSWYPGLRLLNYGALVAEPFFALIPFLPAGHRLKWILGWLMLMMHAGIIASLDVVFANLGCLAALPLLFRQEMMKHLRTTVRLPEPGRWRGIDSFAAVVLFFLVGAMACSLGQRNWRKPTAELAGETQRDLPRMAGGPEQLFFFGGLWAVGLIQQYRLLDWIDDRNFFVRVAVRETAEDGETRTGREYDLVPPGMRASLTLSYLLGATWLPVPPDQMTALRESTLERLARRYAARTGRACRVIVDVTRGRINPAIENPAAEQHQLMVFDCRNGRAEIVEMKLDL